LLIGLNIFFLRGDLILERDDVLIIDYGAGNIGSVVNMFKKCGHHCTVSASPLAVESAKKIVIPGVGHFDHGIEQLEGSGLVDVLDRAVIERKVPVLGICLGMQMMALGSEEGRKCGLGWINAEFKKFSLSNSSYPVPHMAWNTVSIKKEIPLVKGLNAENCLRFYFVHSYYAICHDDTDILMETQYEHNFVSAFQHDNIMGVQFHPEKSHRYGMMLLKNFGDL
jgi:glutamine amidotransferase